MANVKRPDKVVINICAPPSGIVFSESLGKSGHVGVYQLKIIEAINKEQTIQIKRSDSYVLQQLKTASKKLKVRLVFGIKDDFLYVKPIAPSEQEKRLILLLRYPRTLSELMSAKLELDLNATLQRMKDHGTAHQPKADGKWGLTAKGFELLEEEDKDTKAAKA